MGTKTNYFSIGQNPFIKSGIDGQEPILLLVNKVNYDNSGNAPHSHLYLEVLCFLDGEGYLMHGKNKYVINKGDVLIVNPGVIHYLSNDNDKPLEFYSLLLDNIHIEGLKPNSLSKTPIIHKRNDTDTTILNLFNKIIYEISAKKTGWYLSVKGLCFDMLSNLYRIDQTQNKPQITEDNEIYRVKNYIEEYYYNDITLKELVDIVFVNKYHLIHSFKKQFNISPMHYLTIVRINRAKDLLTKTEMSIAEIATKVGFNNPVYFAEQFKKVIGTTPSIYRKITTE